MKLAKAGETYQLWRWLRWELLTRSAAREIQKIWRKLRLQGQLAAVWSKRQANVALVQWNNWKSTSRNKQNQKADENRDITKFLMISCVCLMSCLSSYRLNTITGFIVSYFIWKINRRRPFVFISMSASLLVLKIVDVSSVVWKFWKSFATVTFST